MTLEQQMAADCEMALTIQRAKCAARGIALLGDDTERACFALGFADGAQWAYEQITHDLQAKGIV